MSAADQSLERDTILMDLGGIEANTTEAELQSRFAADLAGLKTHDSTPATPFNGIPAPQVYIPGEYVSRRFGYSQKFHDL